MTSKQFLCHLDALYLPNAAPVARDLRLLPTNIRSPIHEELDYQKQRFGVQAGGHTYKDAQGGLVVVMTITPDSMIADFGFACSGWTRIGVNEKKLA